MAKSRKPRTPPKPPHVGKLVGMCIRLFSTGKEFMLAAAGLVTAIVAMSGSCSNLQRTDASYAALASKVNDMSSRLDSIEESLDDLKSGKAFTCEPPLPTTTAKSKILVVPDLPPPLPSPPPTASEPEVSAFHMETVLKSVPLPETLDKLMQRQQEIEPSPEVKR